MRYLLQIAVMLGDIFIFVAGGYCLWTEPGTIPIVAFALYVWWKQGGFFAWKPSNIRKFLDNAKRAGL